MDKDDYGKYRLERVNDMQIVDKVIAVKIKLETQRYSVRIPDGSDVCHRGCAYRPTVLQTVQRLEVCSAVCGTVYFRARPQASKGITELLLVSHPVPRNNTQVYTES